MICQLQHLRTSQNEIKLNISVAGGAAVWGKAGLNIECGDCELAFIEN